MFIYLTVSQNLEIDTDYMHIFSLEMASGLISEHLFFKIFLGAMPPDPPSNGMYFWMP